MRTLDDELTLREKQRREYIETIFGQVSSEETIDYDIV